MELNGYVYLVKLNTNNNITNIKIGITSKNNNKRAKKHKGEIIQHIQCGNINIIERQLIKLFSEKYDIYRGNEYFSGNFESMVDDFNHCISKYKKEFKLIYLDHDIIINHLKNNNNIIYFDQVFPEIQSFILDMTNIDIFNCIKYLNSLDMLSNEIIIPHTKLIEYNILCNNINNIFQKFKDLNLKENQDYILKKEKIMRIQGGSSIKHTFFITSYTFKLCLLSMKYSNIYLSYIILDDKLRKMYFK